MNLEKEKKILRIINIKINKIIIRRKAFEWIEIDPSCIK